MENIKRSLRTSHKSKVDEAIFGESGECLLKQFHFEEEVKDTFPGATAAAHGDPSDTVATSPFSTDKSLFLDLKPITNMKMSLATENKSCPVEGIGTLTFLVKYKDSFHEITLSDVLFNPKLRRNLLSGSRLESKGVHFVGTKGI
ncbi:uncharacterized protein TNCV_344241 [Trichonephila clavipes]|nr:uncharacterized protein TNCV_344241 [Trichonephila clavipes]